VLAVPSGAAPGTGSGGGNPGANQGGSRGFDDGIAFRSPAPPNVGPP
jgi:hypothetical protein